MHRAACRSRCWRTCLRLCLTVCFVTAITDAAAAGAQQDAPRTDCSSSSAARFNFFPPNAINVPEGWTQQNQRRAGNLCSGQLLPIALYGAPKPLLHFQPQHDLLTAGARVDAKQWAAPKHAEQKAASEKEAVFSIAGYSEKQQTLAAAVAAAMGAAKPATTAAKLQPAAPVVPVTLPRPASVAAAAAAKVKPVAAGRSYPFQGLFGGKPAHKQRKQQLSPMAHAKALQTFIQMLLGGSMPAEIEVSAVQPSSAAAVAAGAVQPQTLRTAAVSHRDGSVEYSTSRGRVLLEGQEQEGGSSEDVAAGAATDSSSSSSSSSSGPKGRSLAEHQAVSAHTLQQRAAAQAVADMQASSAAAGKAKAQPAAATSPMLLGGLLPTPWLSKDRSAQHNAAQASQHVKASLSSATLDSNSNSSSNSSSQYVPELWTVVQPASFVYSVRVNGQPWFTSEVYQPNSSLPKVDFQGNGTANRRDLFDPVIFTEGINTLVINVTLLPGTALLSNGTHNRTGPSHSVTFNSPEIDFYFFMWGNATHDSRPSAVVQFESCRSEAAIRFSNARPTPVLIEGYRLTYKAVPDRTTAFFLPVYHVYGQFQKGLDGSTDLRTDNTEGNIKNFGLYLTRLPGSPSNFSFTGPQLDGLKEGWWQFTVEGSLWVPLPHLAHLLSLSGIDRYGNSDVLYRQVQPNGQVTDGISLLNSVKGAGWVLPEYSNMQVGLQKAVTVLDYFEGPSAPLVLGDKAAFSWQWTGLDSGNTFCSIAGKGTVSLAGNCSSPLTYTVRTNLNQTLTLDYKDVCGKHHNASLTFGPSFGWHIESQALEQGALQLVTAGSQVTMLQKNGGGGGLGGGAAAVWGRALGAAVAAWLLTALLGQL